MAMYPGPSICNPGHIKVTYVTGADTHLDPELMGLVSPNDTIRGSRCKLHILLVIVTANLEMINDLTCETSS